MSALPHGFRIVGMVSSGRRLVDWQVAFRAHCVADPDAEPGRESYLSAFTFGPDLASLQRDDYTLDVRGFDGVCHSPFIWFDLDRDAIETALLDARTLAEVTLHTYRELEDDDLLYWFSGSKGFHLAFPTSLLPADPSTSFHRHSHRFALTLAERAGVRIDEGVYRKVQPLRAPNSRHPKTGLHKVRLSYDELFGLAAARIMELARVPREFELDPPPQRHCPGAVNDWRAAVTQHTAAPLREQLTSASRLTRHTLDFINCVRVPCGGQRNDTLFRAVANLRECGVPLDVIAQLVDAPARDCGLPPREIQSTIRSAVRQDA